MNIDSDGIIVNTDDKTKNDETNEQKKLTDEEKKILADMVDIFWDKDAEIVHLEKKVKLAKKTQKELYNNILEFMGNKNIIDHVSNN